MKKNDRKATIVQYIRGESRLWYKIDGTQNNGGIQEKVINILYIIVESIN